MGHTTAKKLLLSVLILTLLMTSMSSVYAAKPVKTLNISITNVTSTSVTFNVDWDYIGAVNTYAIVHQYYNNTGSFTGYMLGMGEITLAKRTSTYSGTMTINFDYAQYSTVPASGSYGRIRFDLLDRKREVIKSVFSDYFLIP